MGGEGVNTKSNGRRTAVVMVKLKQVADEVCQVRGMETEMIWCMRCRKRFNVCDHVCKDDKSYEDLKAMEFIAETVSLK